VVQFKKVSAPRSILLALNSKYGKLTWTCLYEVIEVPKSGEVGAFTGIDSSVPAD
jgi:hypothetical protein